jgi:hypothetical protein
VLLPVVPAAREPRFTLAERRSFQRKLNLSSSWHRIFKCGQSRDPQALGSSIEPLRNKLGGIGQPALMIAAQAGARPGVGNARTIGACKNLESAAGFVGVPLTDQKVCTSGKWMGRASSRDFTPQVHLGMEFYQRRPFSSRLNIRSATLRISVTTYAQATSRNPRLSRLSWNRPPVKTRGLLSLGEAPSINRSSPTNKRRISCRQQAFPQSCFCSLETGSNEYKHDLSTVGFVPDRHRFPDSTGPNRTISPSRL